MDDKEQLSVTDVAELAGVATATISAYKARGQIPAPDGVVGSTPWWYRKTITDWMAARPGQGWRKGQGGRR